MFSTVPFAPPIPSAQSGRRSIDRQNRENQNNDSSSSPSRKYSQTLIAKFCAPLFLPIPTKRVDKSLILEKLGAVVQELQLSSACRSTCQSHALTYANGNVKRLCRLLDFVLSFGLKRTSDSYWPLAKEFLSKGQIELLLQTWKPKSSRARALSWLYQCLNDGLLEFHMQNFSRNMSGIHRFYAKSAYVWEMETLETVAIFLRGLENVTFRLFSLDQVNSKDFNNGDLDSLMGECCAENERVLTSTSKSNSTTATTPSSSTPMVNPNNPVVKVSPSRKIQRQRGLSTSSVDGNGAATLVSSFETSVADFSECPHVLGLTPDLQDRMLLETEQCDEAIDYNYPTMTFGSYRSSTIFSSKRKIKKDPSARSVSSVSAIPTTTTAVRKIIEPQLDPDQCSLMDESCEISSSMPGQSRRGEFATLDPDTMFSEILARPRIVYGDLYSPPLSSTPIISKGGILMVNGTVTNLELTKDGLEEVGENDGIGKGSTQDLSDPDHQIQSIGHNVTDPGTYVISQRGGQLVNSNESPSENVSASLPNRSPISEKKPEEKGTDFERKIRRRMQTVSDIMATYSDSISEHSAELGKTTTKVVTVGEKAKGVVEEPVVVTNGDGETRKSIHAEWGEILLDSGEIVDLSVHTFTHDGEQFLKMYRIYISHHFGTSAVRFLLLTNYAVYVLDVHQSMATGMKNGDGSSPRSSGAVRKYTTEVVVPYSSIDYISVGANGQLFNIFTIQRKQPVAIICTCNESLTNTVLMKLEATLQRFSSSWSEDKSSTSVPLPDRLGSSGIVTNATPQKIALKKWLCGELGKDDIEIGRYALIYWNPNAEKFDQQREVSTTDDSSNGPSRSGYMYVREYYPINWLWKSNEWKQSYFMLRGKKLYQFEDSTCKVGQRVFDLKEEVSGCRQTQTNEYAYCMEMTFSNDDNVKVHLACQTKHELQQWLYSFAAGFSESDADDVSCECVSCCVVVAGSNLVLGQESSNLGFVRTLAVVRLDDVVSLKWCEFHSSILLEFSPQTEYGHQRWLLSFSCDSEMRHFMDIIGEQQPELSNSQHSLIACDNDTPVCAESSRHWFESTHRD